MTSANLDAYFFEAAANVTANLDVNYEALSEVAT
jgi:hypothetical protein